MSDEASKPTYLQTLVSSRTIDVPQAQRTVRRIASNLLVVHAEVTNMRLSDSGRTAARLLVYSTRVNDLALVLSDAAAECIASRADTYLRIFAAATLRRAGIVTREAWEFCEAQSARAFVALRPLVYVPERYDSRPVVKEPPPESNIGESE